MKAKVPFYNPYLEHHDVTEALFVIAGQERPVCRLDI